MTTTSLPISLRRTLLLQTGGLVVGTAAVVAAVFAVLGLSPMTDRVAESQFDAAAASVEASLATMFGPTEEVLRVSRGRLHGMVLDVDSPEGFNRIFLPVLENLPQVTSVVAGTASGQGWMVLQQPDGRLSNRLTDVPRWGRRHALIERLPDGQQQIAWREVDYDARQRPWYRGAMAGPPGPVHWTAPYSLFTTGDPGITASARLRLADGRDCVIGFDLMLRDLSRTTMKARLGSHGLAMVITDDGRLLALPPVPSGIDEEAWFKRILGPAADLGLAPVRDALAHWQSNGRSQTSIISYRSNGEDWLARLKPYGLGEQNLWVLAVAPAADFAVPWMPLAAGLAGASALVLLLAVLAVRRQARRIATPLEALADVSRRLSEGAPGDLPQIRSRISEVSQLATSQAVIADSIQRDHEKLASQADELHRQLVALQAGEAKYRQLFDTANDGIFLQDETGFVDCNEAGARMYGLPREQVIGRSPLDFCPEYQPDGRRSDAVATEKVRAALAGQAQSFQWQPLRADGTAFDVEITLGRVEVAGKQCLQSIVRDITQRKRADEAIRQLAYFDPLTGLPNRRLLLDRLGHALLASARSRDFGALIMLDLDHFKILNDTQGHDAGDQLLTQVAGRLLTCVRREDTVSRLGGDEYVVMLESLGDQEEAAARQAEAVAEKIRGILNEPCLIGDSAREVHSSASLGVTLFGHRDSSAEILLKQADMALYKAKDAGRNAIRFYNPAMQAAIDEHVRLEAGLRQALARGEFVLHYQPQVAGANGHIVAVEALVRWQHPAEGLVMPDRFIPVAEQTGLILPLGDWVIAEACRQLATWKAEGIVGLRMAVNLSARQLHAPHLVAGIQRALADHGLAGGDLELEVTETTAMQDPEEAALLLHALRGLGLRLAIDDFGTGYSSLSHLRRLPIQTLKLDRSFVRDLEDDSGDAAICAATISLARNLSLQVVAEGVETEAQRYFLSTVHRCELLQGYLFGKPMPADELRPLLLAGQPEGSR